MILYTIDQYSSLLISKNLWILFKSFMIFLLNFS